MDGHRVKFSFGDDNDFICFSYRAHAEQSCELGVGCKPLLRLVFFTDSSHFEPHRFAEGGPEWVLAWARFRMRFFINWEVHRVK